MPRSAISRSAARTAAHPPPILLASAEQVILDLRPHPLFIVLRSLGVLATLIALAVAIWLIAEAFSTPAPARIALIAAGTIIAALLVWNVLVWAMRRYTLTSRRLIRTAGVLRRSTIEIRLDRIQHLQIYRSLRERLFGLGTLGFSTAGTGSTEMVWFMIDHPHERLNQVRAATESAPGTSLGHRPTQSAPTPGAPAAGTPPANTPVADSISPCTAPQPSAHASIEISRANLPIIGLAGGIGAGKSEAARILEGLGCFVINSDQQARAALNRPEVRDQLLRWWGPSILRPDGDVDRSEIAKIIFTDPRERTRLEALIHPLVRARRADLITEAIARRASAAVIDAPLLFEAGVDQECDAILFIDSPRDMRLERLRSSRGWDEAELNRREHVQMPLEEKRQRSTFIISNTADRHALASQLEHALASILAQKAQ